MNERLMLTDTNARKPSDLTAEGQRAVAAIDASISAMQSTIAQRVTGPSGNSDRREPRVFTIDGGRGAGKTTVLLSLFSAHVCEQRQRIALDRIDLDPAPRNVVLMSWLLQPFRKLVRRTASRAAGTRFEPQHEESLSTLIRRLQDAATIGNEIDPHKSTSQLDFAIDTATALQDWEAFECLWEEFVAQLVEHYKASVPEFAIRGVFVVPMDDADLFRGRFDDLLLCLRRLYHPRVVFVVAADLGHWHYVLEQHFAKRASSSQATDQATSLLDKVLHPVMRHALRGHQLHEIVVLPRTLDRNGRPVGTLGGRIPLAVGLTSLIEQIKAPSGKSAYAAIQLLLNTAPTFGSIPQSVRKITQFFDTLTTIYPTAADQEPRPRPAMDGAPASDATAEIVHNPAGYAALLAYLGNDNPGITNVSQQAFRLIRRRFDRSIFFGDQRRFFDAATEIRLTMVADRAGAAERPATDAETILWFFETGITKDAADIFQTAWGGQGEGDRYSWPGIIQISKPEDSLIAVAAVRRLLVTSAAEAVLDNSIRWWIQANLRRHIVVNEGNGPDVVIPTWDKLRRSKIPNSATWLALLAAPEIGLPIALQYRVLALTSTWLRTDSSLESARRLNFGDDPRNHAALAFAKDEGSPWYVVTLLDRLGSAWWTELNDGTPSTVRELIVRRQYEATSPFDHTMQSVTLTLNDYFPPASKNAMSLAVRAVGDLLLARLRDENRSEAPFAFHRSTVLESFRRMITNLKQMDIHRGAGEALTALLAWAGFANHTNGTSPSLISLLSRTSSEAIGVPNTSLFIRRTTAAFENKVEARDAQNNLAEATLLAANALRVLKQSLDWDLGVDTTERAICASNLFHAATAFPPPPMPAWLDQELYARTMNLAHQRIVSDGLPYSTSESKTKWLLLLHVYVSKMLTERERFRFTEADPLAHFPYPIENMALVGVLGDWLIPSERPRQSIAGAPPFPRRRYKDDDFTMWAETTHRDITALLDPVTRSHFARGKQYPG